MQFKDGKVPKALRSGFSFKRALSKTTWKWWQHQPLAYRKGMSSLHRKKCIRELEQQGIGWRAYGNNFHGEEVSGSDLADMMNSIWERLKKAPAPTLIYHGGKQYEYKQDAAALLIVESLLT